MRKLFILMLIALLAGVGIVALIETDPGYVLIAYGNYTLEASFWVGLLVLGLFTFSVYFLFRLLARVLGGQHSLVNWLGTRQARKAGRLTTRGLISYIEGNWVKSRRQLLNGAKGNEAPLLNYLMAARTSARLNEPEKMREYLGAAADAESEAGIAVELTQAEIKLEAGQYEQALATLVRARRNAGRHPYVLDLLRQAYEGLNDWDNLAQLLPELKKYKVLTESELVALERSVYLQLLEKSGTGGELVASEALHSQWQNLPVNLRKDPGLVQSYVGLLVAQGGHEAAEKVILRSLKQQWSSLLVRQYGLIAGANPAKQLAQAESWLAAHEGDQQLLLCLGRLAAREQLWGKAREYFEGSYKLEHSAEICAELGRLLAGLGEPRVSAAYYQQGLLLLQSDLPDLPMPKVVTPHSRRIA